MNKKIILWTAALVLTFLTAFLHQRLSPYYPVSGSIGIEGDKITYLFPKVHYGSDSINILVRKDIAGLQGTLNWRTEGSEQWRKEKLTEQEKYLTVSIKPPPQADTVEYWQELTYNSRSYRIPPYRNVELVFKGKRPASVMNVFYFFLFGGLLLSVRSALEFFNSESRRMLFPLLSTIFFFIASVIFYPFIRSYELNAINRTIPDISSLFDLPLVIIFLLWFLCTLLLYRYKNKILILVTGLAAIIVYQFSSFY